MYRLSRSILLRFEPQFYSTYAAFDCTRVETCFYQRWQFDVLDYLARKPSDVQDMAAELDTDVDQLKDFLVSQVRSGFVIEASEDEAFLPVYVPPRPDPDTFRGFPSPFLSAPSTADIFLTRACNLKCSHCFARGGRPLPNELSFQEWTSTLDQLGKMGVLQVRVNGGEPFMHREIYDILHHLKNMRFRKLILTNGTMLNEKAVDTLVECGVTPTISLDGPTARIHDDFRGATGAFERTLRALKLLRDKGVIYGINTCVHSENIGKIEDMIQLAVKFGAARIGVLGLAEVGRLAVTKKNMISGPERVLLALSLLRLARKYRGKIEIAETLVSHEPPLKTLGAFTCSIDSDGSVYPANRVLGDARFRVGSLREASVRDVWFSRNWVPFRKGLNKIKGLGTEEVWGEL